MISGRNRFGSIRFGSGLIEHASRLNSFHITLAANPDKFYNYYCATEQTDTCVNPIGYSYDYNEILSLTNDDIKYMFMYEISMIPEQMWNV